MKDKMAHKSLFKYGMIVILLVVILFLFTHYSFKRTTFQEGFNHLEEIGKKYGVAFHTEALNYSMVAQDQIPVMMGELEDYRNQLKKEKTTMDNQALQDFIEVRLLMLNASKYFQLGHNIGSIGTVTDKLGFRCAEINYILSTNYYYNLTIYYGTKAENSIDDMLRIYQSIPYVWSIIGTDENKTLFYYSPLGRLDTITKDNTKALVKNCHYDANKPLKPLPPFSTPEL